MKAILPNPDDHNMPSHIVRVEAEKAAHEKAQTKVIPIGTRVRLDLYRDEITRSKILNTRTNSHGLQYQVKVGERVMWLLACKVKKA